jgi:uncharacterized protein YbaR (Trm112 family)
MAMFIIQCNGELMSMDKDLLAILCCPETKQPVSLANAEMVVKLNAAVKKGILKNIGKQLVKEELEGGLVRSDSKIVYPIRENIPVMLIEEGISLEQLP